MKVTNLKVNDSSQSAEQKVADKKSKKNEDKDSERKKKILKPYIGDIDDPNLDEFIVDNMFLKTGYRIGFHTYE